MGWVWGTINSLNNQNRHHFHSARPNLSIDRQIPQKIGTRPKVGLWVFFHFFGTGIINAHMNNPPKKLYNRSIFFRLTKLESRGKKTCFCTKLHRIYQNFKSFIWTQKMFRHVEFTHLMVTLKFGWKKLHPIVATQEVTSDWLMSDSWLTRDWLFPAFWSMFHAPLHTNNHQVGWIN